MIYLIIMTQVYDIHILDSEHIYIKYSLEIFKYL